MDTAQCPVCGADLPIHATFHATSDGGSSVGTVCSNCQAQLRLVPDPAPLPPRLEVVVDD